jgi:predicted nucleic acid-binding protein
MALNFALVSDSTTLISLINIDRFELLFSFSKTIIIAQSVYDEVSIKRYAKHILDRYIANKRVLVYEVKNKKRLKQLTIRLDIGEAESIILAKEKNLPLIIDEKRGKSIAKTLAIQTIGLIGILRVYKVKEILSNDELIEIIDELRKVNFWMSDSLINFILKGE